MWSMEVIQPGRDYSPISNVNLSKIKTGKISGVRSLLWTAFAMLWIASRETFLNIKRMNRRIVL